MAVDTFLFALALPAGRTRAMLERSSPTSRLASSVGVRTPGCADAVAARWTRRSARRAVGGACAGATVAAPPARDLRDVASRRDGALEIARRRRRPDRQSA